IGSPGFVMEAGSIEALGFFLDLDEDPSFLQPLAEVRNTTAPHNQSRSLARFIISPVVSRHFAGDPLGTRNMTPSISLSPSIWRCEEDIDVT
ncbi:hypothetical protein ACFL51_02115, partial [Myxococcota bacterium]